MNLSDVTPMILTHNEEANLFETLKLLSWASQILIIDSFSSDATLEITAEFPQVQVIQRKFDHFSEQCNYGLDHIATPWVLSIDADYKCNEAFTDELKSLVCSHDAYQARFRYGIYGYPLRATLYPPRTVLYRCKQARYERDGHAHRVTIKGSIGELNSAILHDDRKPLTSWLRSQSRYASLEADKLFSSPKNKLNWKDRLRRKIVIVPALTIPYCLIAKGLLLDGWPGMFYTLQRVYAELLLSLVILDRRLHSRSANAQSEISNIPDNSAAP